MNNLTKNIILAPFNLLYKFSPELDLKVLFYLKQHYKLNLKNFSGLNCTTRILLCQNVVINIP